MAHRASAIIRSVIAVFLLCAAARPATADVDLNGRWSLTFTVSFDGSEYPCLVDMAQVDSSLSLTGVCQVLGPSSAVGTVDPVTGDIAASGSVGTFCPSLVLVGVAAPTGDAVTGTFECTGKHYSGAFVGSRSLCGNGLLDSGEDCDGADECCGVTCLWVRAGGLCADDGDACTDDRCDGAGVCAHQPDPARRGFTCGYDDNPCTLDVCDASGSCHAPVAPGTACFGDGNPCTDDVCDGNGACAHPADDTNACDDGLSCTRSDACSAGVCAGTSRPAGSDCGDGCYRGTCDGATTCTLTEGSPCCAPIIFGGLVPAPWDGCARPTRRSSRLRISLSGGDGRRDRLSWKWQPGGDVVVADFGDPTAATDYTLCLYSLTYPFYVADATVPGGGACAGAPCWRANDTGFVYRDRAAMSDGIRGVELKTRAEGNATISVKGRGPNLNLPAPLFPEAGEVLTQLRARNGQCWEARYLATKATQTKFEGIGQ